MEMTYDYHEDADILQVFFTDTEATAAVNLTRDIVLHLRVKDRQAVSLIFNNFSELVRPDKYGPRTFRLQVERWPVKLRSAVLRLLSSPPVNEWLATTSYRSPRVRYSVPLATVRQTPALAWVPSPR